MHVASALSSATIGFVITELMKSGKSTRFGAVVTLVPYTSLDDVQKAVIKRMYVESELAFQDARKETDSDSIQIQKETDFEQWVAGNSFVLDVIQVDGASVGGFISESRGSFFFIHRLFLIPNYKKSQSAKQAVQLFEAAHKYPVLKVQDNKEMLFWKSCGFTESKDPNTDKFELEKSASSSTCQGVSRCLDTKYAPQPQDFHLYLQRFNFFKSMRKASFADVTLTCAPLKTVYEKDNKYDVFYKKECVGSVSYTVVSGLQGNSITVSSLHINEKHRERGLGMCVILRLEKDYIPQEIVAENVFFSAQGFWEKCGFKPLGDASCSHYIKRCNEH